MNIPYLIKLKDGREIPVSIPDSICALGNDFIAKYAGYAAFTVAQVVRVS